MKPTEAEGRSRLPTDEFVRRMNAITVMSVSSLLAAGLAVGFAIWMAKQGGQAREG